MLTLEFTIEPFVEGQPGPHVLEAVAAVEAFGIAVEFGPFGSSCVIPEARAGELTRAIISAAFANGATHVSMSADRITADESSGDGGRSASNGVDEWTDPADPADPGAGERSS